MKPSSGLWRGLCPRCGRAPIFYGRLKMHRACPSCGLRFEREPGYFVGAMMFSYVVAALIYVPIFLALRAWAHQTTPWLLLYMLILFAPVAPWVFRCSRILWIYFDRTVDPDK